jgi:hypothetical protein
MTPAEFASDSVTSTEGNSRESNMRSEEEEEEETEGRGHAHARAAVTNSSSSVVAVGVAATVMDARAVPTWLHAQIEYLRNNAPLPLKVHSRHLFPSSASFYIALIGCCLCNFKARG